MPVFGGQWTPADEPQRSGLYINVRTQSPTAPLGDAGGTVALVVDADWGPENTIQEIVDRGAAERIYGPDGTAAFAVEQALLGSGDRAGAARVLVYRIVGDTPVKASVTLQNTGDASALTLTAKYAGVRANGFTITSRVNPSDGTKRDILIYEGSNLLETWTFANTGASHLADAAAYINANSRYVTATVVADGTSLKAYTGQALTGGTAGSALDNDNYITMMAAFEAIAGDYSVMAFDDYAGLAGGVQSLVREWVVRLNNEGALFHLVVGGAAAETVATALARTEALDSEWTVNLTRDIAMGGVVYSSSEMAPRVAGIIAAAGVTRTLTFSQIPEGTVSNPPTATEAELLVRGGVIPFVRGEGGSAMLQRGRTAFISTTVDKNDKYRELLNVRKMAYGIRRLSELVRQITSGDEVVNDPVLRDAIMGRFREEISSLVSQRVFVSGTTVELDDAYANDNNVLHIKLTAKPAPSIEVVLATWSVPA